MDSFLAETGRYYVTVSIGNNRVEFKFIEEPTQGHIDEMIFTYEALLVEANIWEIEAEDGEII